MSKALTIKDIAKLSGFSTGTVSRVLNNRPDVRKETKEKIEKIIRDNHYQPNVNAKQLKKTVSSNIVIIVKGYGNMLFADLLEQVQGNLSKKREEASVIFIDENQDEVLTAYQMLIEKKPKGFIFLGGNLDNFKGNFKKISVPCVLLTCDASGLPFDHLSSFTTNDAGGAASAIQYLLENHHQKIGIVGGTENSQITQLRVSSCMEVLQNHHVSFHTDYYEDSRFSMEGGYAGTVALLKRHPDISAIFAVSDTIAVGAMAAIRDSGKKVPEDISIIGFDGIGLGHFIYPRLSTIHQDTQELAKRGVDDLLLRIAYHGHGVHEEIPYQLIKGASIKKL
ncbi:MULTISPECIES: LacI family DNA-binding transcriptional regulator [Terrabacteria group]|uniref:LacI family DNA-binding transcriptional regulator n=1 Tax=Bacillati TaxID=1783272 RepID=UPI001C6E5B03|nr:MULTISPECIES: LacI family DNA-binding transcriptional regulator [Terrabacteria group]MBW9213083.1 LacI family transcriptional regulator [Trueperella sp. zg.1013]